MDKPLCESNRHLADSSGNRKAYGVAICMMSNTTDSEYPNESPRVSVPFAYVDAKQRDYPIPIYARRDSFGNAKSVVITSKT